MTNLSTEAKAELQRMIDIGATHMRAQGEVCVNSPGTRCLYCGPNGLKCFAGALIADEYYTEVLENETTAYSEVVTAIEYSGYSVLANDLVVHLARAQNSLHDDLEHARDFPAAFEAALILYCSEYGLDYTAPGEA
jgi:diaminopimelate epimerase